MFNIMISPPPLIQETQILWTCVDNIDTKKLPNKKKRIETDNKNRNRQKPTKRDRHRQKHTETGVWGGLDHPFLADIYVNSP